MTFKERNGKWMVFIQSVIYNVRAASEIFKKGHFWGSFTQKYLKLTLFLEKRGLFCQILQKAASDYLTLISFGLFLGCFLPEYPSKVRGFLIISSCQ